MMFHVKHLLGPHHLLNATATIVIGAVQGLKKELPHG
jgi:hypothetical protein